ncbi:hypothetical protein ENSA5_70020 [Enhygromyxa salina]|uniref:Uncharacterized protein n=1 Tax=Enhygromyxa salina TaxID=215803 RepID=A0A2S9XAL4_9BACT|nr:hypothetical protein [Enhygromyxa salina]PRP89895.1 hypothetical protein ENSA5_70020 [Enhygromyxa salina]
MAMLDLLSLMLSLVIETLDQVPDTHGVAGQARDLQDAISSYWRAVHDGEGEDELPF